MINPFPAQDVSSDIDLEELRRKYRQERDKRLRPEGDLQYLEAGEQLAHYAEHDPHVTTEDRRDPLAAEMDIAIIGGGFAGLFAAARMLEAGLTDIRIIEAGADLGGAWYWNRYPGCQCDVESYCYIPLLEETGYMPTMRYAYWPEIFEQCKRIGRHYGLYDRALFSTRVRELRWDEQLLRWRIGTDHDDDIKARFVITATGPLGRPKLPGIKGIESFRGHSFHTSRWDYAYTGGGHAGGLSKLADKNVAIIGSASSAVQCIPHLAESAKHLYVFQRTPTACFPRRNSVTDPAWVSSLTPGWQQERIANFNAVLSGQPVETNLVSDCWTEIYGGGGAFGLGGDVDEERARRAEFADAEKMNKVRDRIDRVVRAADVAETLKPWFSVLCKRPTFHDDYYDSFNRDNVTLVDVSETRGVERIIESGIATGGVNYDLDCIIFGTGFEISTDYHRRVDFQTYGIGGQSLSDYWKDGRRTYHGHSVHGFPNLFNVGLSQNALSMNFSSMYGGQAQHIAYIIKEVRARGGSVVQPTRAAEADWVKTIKDGAKRSTQFLEDCTPGYYNSEGRFGRTSSGFLDDIYTGGIASFHKLMEDWREEGQLRGLSIS